MRYLWLLAQLLATATSQREVCSIRRARARRGGSSRGQRQPQRGAAVREREGSSCRGAQLRCRAETPPRLAPRRSRQRLAGAGVERRCRRLRPPWAWAASSVLSVAGAAGPCSSDLGTRAGLLREVCCGFNLILTMWIQCRQLKTQPRVTESR